MLMGRNIDAQHTNWDDNLSFVVAAYNATTHESTGFSPNFLMFARNFRSPIDLCLGRPPAENRLSYVDFVESRLSVMERAYSLTREHLGIAATRAKKYYDMKVKPLSFHVGQFVYYYCPRRFSGKSFKWSKCYSGPFCVVQILGRCNVRLQKTPRSQTFITHIDKIKEYIGPRPPVWQDKQIDDTQPDTTNDHNDVDVHKRNKRVKTRKCKTDVVTPNNRDTRDTHVVTSYDEMTPKRPRRIIKLPKRYI